MNKTVHLRALIATAVTGLLLGSSVNAVAAESTTPAAEPSKRLVYVPHKTGYPFNLREVPNETAEFARVETAPGREAVRRGPPPKTGNPFVPLN